jgi:hypothetical protein
VHQLINNINSMKIRNSGPSFHFDGRHVMIL